MSQVSLPAIEKSEISLYSGELTTRAVTDNVARIKKAFPLLPMGFYDAFTDRIMANNFCDERLLDAVNFVIDNCPYPTPSIANFISYDRTIKFKTHEEMCKEAMTYDKIWDEWLAVKFPDRPKVVWIYANDIEKYKLLKYMVKNGKNL